MNRRKDTRGLRIAVIVGGLLLLVLSVSCGSRFPDPSQQGEFERIVLLEEGTGTWCVYCPDAAENIEELTASHPGEFIVLALHKQDEYSSEETEARLASLGVGKYPTIVFDGVEAYEGVQSVEEMEQVLEDRRALGSPVKLELSASLTEDSVLYEITVIASALTENTIEGTLRIALVEDTITDASVGLLHHIVRRLPEATGDDALTLEQADTVNLHRALPLDQSWGRPLTAVVWIEASDLTVYQAASYELEEGGPDLGDFAIEMEQGSDTIQSVSQPGDTAFYYFTLRNYATEALTLHIELPNSLKDLPAGWDSKVCDEDSCYADSFDVTLPADGSSQMLHVQILSSIEGMEGKVVMTVSAGGAEVDSITFILRIEEPGPGEFSIEVASDTIQTKPNLGDSANYYFNLKNHTSNALTLTVDLPEDSLELPTGWGASICEEGSCYPIPFDVEVPANGTSQEFHLTITSGTEGIEGKVLMTVTDGEEVDRQTFILRIQE